jgi:hypothetical protein
MMTPRVVPESEYRVGSQPPSAWPETSVLTPRRTSRVVPESERRRRADGLSSSYAQFRTRGRMG